MVLTSSTVRAVALAVVIGIVAVPNTAAAGRGHGGHGGGKSIGSRGTFDRHSLGHQQWKAWGQHAFQQHRFGQHGFADHRSGRGHRSHGGFVSSFVPFGSPSVIVAPVEPLVVVPPVSAMAVSPPVAAPPVPMPRVVEYPHGRYELRGDGVTTPYVWVWVPNPPPPPAPPPQAPTPPASDRSPTPERDAAARATAFYCFTDERGVTIWTDQLQRIPEPYRAAARRAAEDAGSPRCVASG